MLASRVLARPSGGHVRGRPVTALLAVALTAILTAACGPPPGAGPAVEITTERTAPVAFDPDVPVPYSMQLEATGADPAAIKWSLVRGELPIGLSLAPDGLISGTGGPTPAIVQVRASAGGPVDTKLLAFLPPSNLQLTSSGAALPDGSKLVIRHSEEHGQFVALVNYSDDGVASVPAGYTVEDASHLDQYPVLWAAMSPDGSRAALNVGPVRWGTPSGPTAIVDSDTGAVTTTLAEEVDHPVTVAFSPDGRYLLGGVPGDSTKVFDSATGALLRTVPTEPGTPVPLTAWISADEFARESTGGEVDIFSATGEAHDRTLALGAGCRGPHTASAATQRMALACGDDLVTVSTIDGTAARVVNKACVSSTCALTSITGEFSPTGSHLAFTGTDSSGYDTVFVVADQENATPTALATVSSSKWDRAVVAAWH